MAVGGNKSDAFNLGISCSPVLCDSKDRSIQRFFEAFNWNAIGLSSLTLRCMPACFCSLKLGELGSVSLQSWKGKCNTSC